MYPLERIFFDVTNVCNLRCPFCSFDYSTIKKGQVIDDATFKKVLELAPLVPDGCFSLSCEHEATMHPRFGEIIKTIPEYYRKKFFFTSNMATKITDKLIDILATSNINYINISCDTLDETRFRQLRVGGELSVFLKNVDRLTLAFRDNPKAPDIRFITMGFQSTFSELDKVIEFGKQHLAVWHEIRFLFDVPHIGDDFKRRELLDSEQWRYIARKFKADSTIHVFMPPEDYKYWNRDEDDSAPTTRMVSLKQAARIEDLVDDDNGEPLFAMSREESGDAAVALAPQLEEGVVLESPESGRSSKKKSPQPTNRPAPAAPQLPWTAPLSRFANPPTLFVKPDGAVFFSEWGKEQFSINLLSIPDVPRFFEALMPDSVRERPPYRYETLPLLRQPWNDASYSPTAGEAADVWSGRLWLSMFCPADIPSFRIAACAVNAAEDFVAVAERYLPVKAGANEWYFSMDEFSPLKGTLTPATLNRVNIGGLGIDGDVLIGLTLQTDKGFTPLHLTTGRAMKLVRYEDLPLAQAKWVEAECTIDPEFAAELWTTEVVLEVFSPNDVPLFKVFGCSIGSDGKFAAVREKYLPIKAGSNEFRLSMGDMAPLNGVLAPDNFNSLRIGGMGVDGDVKIGIRFVDNNRTFPALRVGA